MRLLLLAAIALAATACAPREEALTFWAMGTEGQKVAAVLEPFLEAHPEITLKIQAIPWAAAHDKLLTAYAGGVTPDLCQLGSTWVTEFQALGALEPLDEWLAQSPDVDPADYFEGVWNANRFSARQYGIPWYVDTRALFYRKDLLKDAGFEGPPETWDDFFHIAKALTRDGDGDGKPERYGATLPVNPGGDPVPLYMAWQRGADLIDQGTLRGTASSAAFKDAVSFYVKCFDEGVAPREVGHLTNFHQAFAQGDFAMFIEAPWNVNGLKERYPALTGKWAVSPLPAVDRGGKRTSVAGGSSLAIFEASPRKGQAWALIRYLSRPEVQARFYEATADLPPRKSAWSAPGLNTPEARAFYAQMQDTRPVPPVPEWERLAAKMGAWIERAVYHRVSVEAAVAGLDADLDAVLEKRRWLASRDKERQ